MTRRRLFAIACIVALAACAIGLWLLWPAPSAITRENAAKIKDGMTRAEVEAILGGPARDETTGPIDIDTTTHEDADVEGMHMLMLARVFLADEHPSLVWRSDYVIIRMRLDADGVVSVCRVVPVCREPESPLDRIRRWLRF
jgi:hypothetical protein